MREIKKLDLRTAIHLPNAGGEQRTFNDFGEKPAEPRHVSKSYLIHDTEDGFVSVTHRAKGTMRIVPMSNVLCFELGDKPMRAQARVRK